MQGRRRRGTYLHGFEDFSLWLRVCVLEGSSLGSKKVGSEDLISSVAEACMLYRGDRGQGWCARGGHEPLSCSSFTSLVLMQHRFLFDYCCHVRIQQVVLVAGGGRGDAKLWMVT